MKDNIIFHAPGNEFLKPYMAREFAGFEGNFALMVSSTDIYEPDPEGILNEDAPLRTDSGWKKLEDDFLKEYPQGYILRTASIIGTGMTCAMRRLTEEIYRGRFFHFPDNDARKSVVHASDIARAALLLANGANRTDRHIFNISDDCDPTLHDIAEAIAYRLANKRISTLSTKPQQWFGRKFYGERYKYYTTTERVSCEALKAAIGFTPVPVCEYLRTHVYDENSL